MSQDQTTRTQRKNYDSTVMRIAGNLLSGNPFVEAGRSRTTHRLLDGNGGMLSQGDQDIIAQAVMVARAIAAEVQRTSSRATAPPDAEER
jgi:hypothetical protein